MKLKTYLTTYLLFILILFLCFGIVSAFVTHSQINMHMEKSAREFQTIAQTLFKDISIIQSRGNEFFSQEVTNLVAGYATFYRRNGITIELVDLNFADDDIENMIVSFAAESPRYFINVSGLIPEPFNFYRLDYSLDISLQIAQLRTMQNTLLVICALFSVITGFVLYVLFGRIFKPLGLVSEISRQIADGHYSERIHLAGNNEISAMAGDFNRMAEKIESEIEGKQRFIDNFAHEIRTPLTSVFGNAEYMQKAVLDEDENIKLTQSIMDRTNHIKQIADSLLRLATLRNYKPSMKQINLRQLFAEIAQTLFQPIGDIHFTYESDAEFLNGQEDLIKSLLLNVCLNALKAAKSIVSVKAEKHENNVVLSVADNGNGIPKECLEKVTEPFYRVEKSRNRRYGGAGLGLTLCKQIADVHGAVMVIESEEGVGTKVTVTFTTPL